MASDTTSKLLAAIRAELVRRANETADAIERMLLDAQASPRTRRRVAAPANDDAPDELARARARRILKQFGMR